MEPKSDVYFAVLHETDQLCDDIEHAVVVDAELQLIIGSCERIHIQMTWSVLQKCVGPVTELLFIDISKLHRHYESSSKRKDLRNR